MSQLRAGVTLLLSATVLIAVVSPAAAQVEAARWVLSGTVRETLTDNLFLVNDGPGESITGGTASAAYSRRAPDSSLSAFGWANGQVFGTYRAYDGVQGGLGVFGQRSLTRRTKAYLGLSFSDGLNLEALNSSRVGLPQVDVKSVVGTTGLSYAITPSTSLRADLDANAIRYRTDERLSTASLPADQLTVPDLRFPSTSTGQPPSEVPSAPDASQQALALLAAEPVQVLRLDFWTWHGAMALAQELSAKTRLTFNLGYRQTGEDPRTFSAGEQLEAGVTLRRVIDPTANASLVYDYQDNRFLPRIQVHTVTGQAEKQFSSKVKGDASFGASFLDGTGSYDSGWTFVGGAGLDVRLEHSSLYFRYERSRYQALVLGRNQTVDLVFGSAGHTLSKRVWAAAYGYYRRARDPIDLYSYDTAAVGGSLIGRFAKRTSGGLSYEYRDFYPRGFQSADRSVLSFFVAYSRISK